jgi:hypothetical protein
MKGHADNERRSENDPLDVLCHPLRIP